MLMVSVVVDPGAFLVRVSLLLSMVVEDSTGTVDWCVEPERQTCLFLPVLPTAGAWKGSAGGKGVAEWT
jgi:hypothetical protein